MIDAALSERFALNSRGPPDAIARISRKGGRDALNLCDCASQCACIFDGLSRALRKEWSHRMSRVADQRRAPK